MNYYDKQRKQLFKLIRQSIDLRYDIKLLTNDYLDGVINTMIEYTRLLNVIEENFEDKMQDYTEKSFELFIENNEKVIDK